MIINKIETSSSHTSHGAIFCFGWGSNIRDKSNDLAEKKKIVKMIQGRFVDKIRNFSQQKNFGVIFLYLYKYQFMDV